MAYIPEEVVVEIMSRLPPESLIQSKCVNKHWYFLIDSLINDPSFVSKHLRNLKPPSSTVAVTCLRLFPDHPARRHEELFSLLSLSYAGAEKISSATEFLDLPTIPDERDTSSVAVSHCNGVICQADYFDNIVLSNPAINKSRTLPKPGLVDRFISQGVGFGYDSGSDDYKVVRFGRDMASARHRAEIYSLRTDTWREIEPDSSSAAAVESYYFPSLNVELYLEGRFYWLMTSSGQDYRVRWFDMSSEVFSTVDVPESVHVARARWTSLGVWEGRVGLFLCVGGEEEEVGPLSVEVWVMENAGCRVNGSWVKKLTIGPVEGIDCPLAFWKSDELLMRGSDCKEVVSYNICTGQVRHVGVDGLDAIGCRAFSYVKSLVSV